MEPQRGASTRLGGLDLIRVVAVVAVLLYHADDTVPGGLLGVTVFFTLSGFLITGPLWGELRSTDRIDLARFWSRRVRRLVPPSLLTVAVIAAVWPLLGYDLSSGDVVGAVLPVRNWTLLWSNAGYGASPSPTSHFWSLAVEEQIYLVLPVAIWALWRIGRERLVIVALAMVTAVSMLAGAVMASQSELDRAYLDTSTRLGELVAGALLAVVVATRRAWFERAGRSIGLIGIGALAVMTALFVSLRWPSSAVSVWGIPATVAASALACLAATRRGGWLERAGSLRTVRVAADHAYELYLVHVPVYLVVTTYRTGLDGPALLGARLAVTMVAAAGLHAVTAPIRDRRWLGSGLTLGAAVVPVAIALVAVMAVAHRPHLGSASASAADLAPMLPVFLDPTPPPVPAAVAPPEPASAAPRAPVPAEPEPPVAATIAPAVDDRPTVWLVGDSTLRELEDPERTATPLSSALADAGWHVTGFVGVRALALCGERPWDETGDGQAGRMLPAVRDAVAGWYAESPAEVVVVQLGSNDLTQLSLSDGELRNCVEAFLAALPADTAVEWVVPAFGPWCWCDVERAHHDAVRFADVLASIATDDPRLRLLLDGLVVTSESPRDVWAEDGVHATGAGRELRVSSLVDQLLAPA